MGKKIEPHRHIEHKEKKWWNILLLKLC